MAGCTNSSGKPNFASGEPDPAYPPAVGTSEINPWSGDVVSSPGGVDGTCTFDYGRVSLSSVELLSVTLTGFAYEGEDPVHQPAGTGFTVVRTESACPGTNGATSGDNVTFPGGPGNVKWWRSASLGPLAECFSNGYCQEDNPEACSGAYNATLTYTNTEVACALMGPYKTTFFGVQRDNNDAVPTSSQNGCVAGTAHFELVPLHVSDYDHDGLRGGSLLAIQTSGTGTLTRNAWISSITPTSSPAGGTLRVLTGFDAYRYAADDSLDNASQISTVISGTTSFPAGTLRGNSPFVASDMSVADLNSYEVDMTWTCGSGAPAVSRPAGYTFKLSDLGCPGTQRMTLRVANTPPRVTLEQYGYLGTWFTTFTAPTADGAGFVFHEGELVVAGAVVSSNAQQAVVTLQTATYNGVSACTPGTYTLPREQ